jgi:hypothetical protein
LSLSDDVSASSGIVPLKLRAAVSFGSAALFSSTVLGELE